MITIEIKGNPEALIGKLRAAALATPAQLQARASRVAEAARRDAISTRAAASVQVTDTADGAEVRIGGPAPKPHAAGYRTGKGSTLSGAGKIAYRKLRPKVER